jgi:hypothetical protein
MTQVKCELCNELVGKKNLKKHQSRNICKTKAKEFRKARIIDWCDQIKDTENEGLLWTKADRYNYYGIDVTGMSLWERATWMFDQSQTPEALEEVRRWKVKSEKAEKEIHIHWEKEHQKVISNLSKRVYCKLRDIKVKLHEGGSYAEIKNDYEELWKWSCEGSLSDADEEKWNELNEEYDIGEMRVKFYHPNGVANAKPKPQIESDSDSEPLTQAERIGVDPLLLKELNQLEAQSRCSERSTVSSILRLTLTDEEKKAKKQKLNKEAYKRKVAAKAQK